MVSRIEIFLALLLLFFLSLAFVTQQEIEKARAQKLPVHKSVEVSGARVREVNATSLISAFEASKAELIQKTWYLDDFMMRNADIKSLRSRHARRTKENIRLEGNVTLHRLDDSLYRAETVIYDRKRKTLRSVGPFRGEKEQSFVRGVDFFYETGPRRTRAEKVFAHYLLGEGGEREK